MQLHETTFAGLAQEVVHMVPPRAAIKANIYEDHHPRIAGISYFSCQIDEKDGVLVTRTTIGIHTAAFLEHLGLTPLPEDREETIVYEVNHAYGDERDDMLQLSAFIYRDGLQVSSTSMAVFNHDKTGGWEITHCSNIDDPSSLITPIVLAARKLVVSKMENGHPLTAARVVIEDTENIYNSVLQMTQFGLKMVKEFGTCR